MSKLWLRIYHIITVNIMCLIFIKTFSFFNLIILHEEMDFLPHTFSSAGVLGEYICLRMSLRFEGEWEQVGEEKEHFLYFHPFKYFMYILLCTQHSSAQSLTFTLISLIL
jgi:hypothetical protein